MTDFTIEPAGAVEPAVLHGALRAAFADYLIGPFTSPFDLWPVFLGQQGTDLAQSRVVLVGGDVAAYALVAPRPDIGWWRLSMMGAVPAARGSGAAPALLDDFIARARSAGLKGVELECFAQNERAIRLYRSRGFEPLHELRGYTRAASGASTSNASAFVDEAPLEDAYAWLDAASLRVGDLPLQVTPRSLRAGVVPLRALRRGAAVLVSCELPAGEVVIKSLVDLDAGQRDAQALAAQLIAAWPGRKILAPQLQRPDLGGDALERLGFAREPLHQVLMRRRF